MKKKILIFFVSMILILATGVWYIKDYYRSEVTVQEYIDKGDVTITKINDGLFLDGIGKEDALVFYPGGKVEYTSYLPLLYQLAKEGIDCFLVKMPCNLAFLGIEKADDIMERYSYKNWYLSGHSLGGAMAAVYAADEIEDIDGLVLLAAYPTAKLYKKNFFTISLYGSEDKVVNFKKIEEGRNYVSENYTEICIEGGNHAWFGNYGQQKGDGTASITREEQQKQVVDAVLDIVEKGKQKD